MRWNQNGNDNVCPNHRALCFGSSIGRWIKVVIFGLAVTFTSCLYAGWQQYSLILIRGERYQWLCTDLTESEPGLMSCETQERRIGSLFSIAAGFELIGAIVAGIVLDRWGPRHTAIAGSLLGIVATIMLICSGQRIDLMPLSLILTGISINLIAFPALALERDFPNAAATTAAYVVSCQCLSSILAPVIWFLWERNSHWTFEEIWTVYLCVIWIPVSVLYWIALPSTNHPNKTANQVDQSSPCSVQSSQEIAAAEPETTAEFTPPPFDWIEFWAACCSRPFLLMNFIGILLMLDTVYYQLIIRKQSGILASNFLGWTMPLQAFWGLILGRITDHIKTPAMTIILLFLYMIVYSAVLLGPGVFQLATATLFNIATSYAFTVKYSFVQETFERTYFGTLVGILGCVGGISMLLVNVLTITMTPEFWCSALALFSVVAAGGALWCRFLVAERSKKKLDQDGIDIDLNLLSGHQQEILIANI